MLSAEENEKLTRIGPSTPMGDLLRRYWQPVAATSEMANRATLRIKILGESLILFKDRGGRFGLITEHCPHRGVSLANGIPTEDGIRCPYHGWRFDNRGHCVEQPNEADPCAAKDKIITPAYPVEELGGLIFAYLGPSPAPCLPRFDAFAVPGAIRTIGKAMIPCNWLQIMENSVDPVHTQWLHGAFYEYLHEKEGVRTAVSRRQAKAGFDEFAYGIIKRRLYEGQSEDAEDWKTGHPLVFPNSLAVGSAGGFFTQYTFQIRVPIDDTHTQHYWYHAYLPPKGVAVPPQLRDSISVYEPPVTDADGNYLTEYVHAQDIMAWVTQGPIADRTKENLTGSDRGLALYRRMLKRELEKVARGEDPLGTIRDPADNTLIELPRERDKQNYSEGFATYLKRHMLAFSPIADELVALFDNNAGKTSAKQTETVG